MGSSSSGSSPLVLTQCALWVEQADASAEPRYLSLWLPLFLIIFLYMFQEALLALKSALYAQYVLNSFGKNLVLVCFQQCPPHAGRQCRLLQFCRGNICGAFLLNSACSLDAYNITFLVDSHVCGRRSNSLFSERPFLFPFVSIILADNWKMVVLAKKAPLLL